MRFALGGPHGEGGDGWVPVRDELTTSNCLPDRTRSGGRFQKISREFRPGEELDEKRLADLQRFAPRFAALRQLAASELVGGVRINSYRCKITPSRMVEMFDMMAELEGFCGRLAARRMTQVEHAELIAIHKQFAPYLKSGNKEGYHAMNKTFHRAIYKGSHNRYLADQASALHDRIAPYRAFQLRRPDALRLASLEHQMIIDAIVSGDGDKAFKLLVDHVSLNNELFADLIAALNLADRESHLNRHAK
jgi:DNA-binding GntR family transcriptional regulator